MAKEVTAWDDEFVDPRSPEGRALVVLALSVAVTQQEEKMREATVFNPDDPREQPLTYELPRNRQ